MSAFDDLRDPAGHDGDVSPNTASQAVDRSPDLDMAASVAGESVAGTASAPANPRKRKKSSRACDFCHVNHQPCDNAKPRCGYCERHNKSCLYLRPQKKRGPAQGYRSALHTLRESAAAWGAALNLIPSLGPVVEGYLNQPEGRRLVKAIKDPAQQEFFIQAWQQSGVFKAFFPDERSPSDKPLTTPDAPPPLALPQAARPVSQKQHQPPAAPNPNALPPAHSAVISPPRPPVQQLSQAPQLDVLSIPKPEYNPFGFVPTPSPSSQDGGSRPRQSSLSARGKSRQESISFSDILAKDAARSSLGFSQTLGSLGFAPNETLEDFLDMSFNPEPREQPSVPQDSLLGSEQDQQAYYELLMGRRLG